MPLSDRVVDERNAAYARVAHELNSALSALQRARATTRLFAIGLELPAERQFIDAINACAKAREREQT